jgi:hypothetical protein
VRGATKHSWSIMPVVKSKLPQETRTGTSIQGLRAQTSLSHQDTHFPCPLRILCISRTFLGGGVPYCDKRIWNGLHVNTLAYACLRLPTLAYACLRLPMPAYACLRLPTLAYACLRLPTPAYACLRLPTPAPCLRLPTPAYAWLSLRTPVSKRRQA